MFLDKRILTIESPGTDQLHYCRGKISWSIPGFGEVAHHRSKIVLRQFSGVESRAGDRLSQIVKAALNEEITKRSVRDMISGERDKVIIQADSCQSHGKQSRLA